MTGLKWGLTIGDNLKCLQTKQVLVLPAHGLRIAKRKLIQFLFDYLGFFDFETQNAVH